MKKVILTLVVVAVLLIGTIGALAAYVFNWVDFDGEDSSGSGGGTVLKNPAEGLTDEEAIAIFDEGFVYYVLVSIGAGKLHNPPFSSDTPKIEFRVGEEFYSAEVVENRIKVLKGEMPEEDIIITTTKLEAVKMVRDRAYIKESFSNGGSGIDLVAGKTRLASKGYLELYGQFS